MHNYRMAVTEREVQNNRLFFLQSHEIPLALSRENHLHNSGNPPVLSSKSSQSQMASLHTVIKRYETGAFGCPTTT